MVKKIEFYRREVEEKMEAAEIRFPTVAANNLWPASQREQFEEKIRELFFDNVLFIQSHHHISMHF